MRPKVESASKPTAASLGAKKTVPSPTSPAAPTLDAKKGAPQSEEMLKLQKARKFEAIISYILVRHSILHAIFLFRP